MGRRLRLALVLSIGLLAACRGVFGIDDSQPLLPDGDSGAEAGDSDGAVSAADASKDAGTAIDASKDAGKDAGPSVCPSSAAICQPQTMVPGLLSPGELSVMGTKLAFREHAKVDGGKVSAVRVFDPAGACKVGSCLPTVTTGPNNYTRLATNAAHICFTSETYASNEYVTCKKTDAAFTDERTVLNETWFYQAEFVETDTLLYGGPVSSSLRAVRVIEPTTTKAAYSAISGLTGSVDYVAANADPASMWFGWVDSYGGTATDHIGSRAVADNTAFNFTPQDQVIALTTVDDNLVWSTMYEIRVARYTANGLGTALPAANVVTCDQGSMPAYKSLARAPNAVVAIEGCDIPGSLGSKLVLYPLDGSAPQLLATALSSLTSAAVLGDYVYYTVGRLDADLSSVPTEELRRVRFR